MRCLLLSTHLSLLLFLILGSSNLTALGFCPTRCGKILIPSPFGIGKGCYLNEWFAIQCKNSTSGELVPYLPKINKEVVEISLPDPVDVTYGDGHGSVRVKTNITSKGCSNSGNDEIMLGEPLNLTGSPFTINRYNSFVAVGCNIRVTLANLEPKLVGCFSTCGPRQQKGDLSVCNGYKFCQTDIPDETINVIRVHMEDITTSNTTKGIRGCRVAFLTDDMLPVDNLVGPRWFYNRQYVIVQLRWVIPVENISFIKSLGCYHEPSPSFDFRVSTPCRCYFREESIHCRCTNGYKGNPYLLDGCNDINECHEEYLKMSNLSSLAKKSGYRFCDAFGGKDYTCVNTPGSVHCVNKRLPIAIGLSVGISVMIFIGVSVLLYKFIKRRKKINRKKNFFKRNGGLLLQQQLISTGGSIEKTIVFNSKELEKATENFSLNRILGQGGQGTVYKGMLVDGRIVAVKKSKVVDEDKLEEFINEVVILSQINHRNIVKLLGCCLETEVPLLVYEFIPNGNLFEHLHDETNGNTMSTWEVRLRIAIEIAGALSYLHSAASSPIYHRDIKTTNIMLDEKYQAKVSDFGTSRSVTVDHTHLTTVVSGTVGYVDPEYYQSSQFTDKSDVYSFGVVLVELITGEKPVSFLRSQENRTLATYFIFAMEDNRVVDIVDPRIKDDCKLEQVMAASQLARRCLNLNGKNRPSMREVSMELERIRSPSGDSEAQVQIVKNEVAVEFNVGMASCNNVTVTAPLVFEDNVATTSWLDAEPLFPRQTW